MVNVIGAHPLYQCKVPPLFDKTKSNSTIKVLQTFKTVEFYLDLFSQIAELCFLTAIYLPYCQLWTTVKQTAPLTRRWSLRYR